MKKLMVLFLLTVFVCLFTTACAEKKVKKQNLIQSKRRFAQYMEPQSQKDMHSIDLSEGPKLKYDAQLGPQNLNFDIKIVDPY